MNKLSLLTNEQPSRGVLEYIEGEIIHGRLRKGDKLPTERHLAEELCVSRASVREALKALESMGMIVAIQGSGNYIAPSPDTAVDRAMCALFALNDGTLENILQLRILLEIEVCRDICKNASEEDIANLASIAAYDYDNPSVDYQVNMDHDFHSAIVLLSRNTLIKYLYNTLSSLMNLYREQVLVATIERDEHYITQRDHMAIVDALKGRNSCAAEKAIRTHLELNQDYSELLNKTYKSVLPQH